MEHGQKHQGIRKMKEASRRRFSFFSLVVTGFCLSFFFQLKKGDATSGKTPKVVGMTQIVDHPSLNRAKEGILDVLKENGYEEGKNLTLREHNAQGNMSHAVLIARKLVAANPDVLVPISTPSAQTIVNAAKDRDIPIVFCSVADPVAAGIVQTLDKPNTLITGAMDFPDLEKVVVFIGKTRPSLKKLGVLYSAGEVNARKIVTELGKQVALGPQWEVIPMTVTDSNQVGQAFKRLMPQVDGIYIPSDNTIFAAMPIVVKLSLAHKFPVFSSDPDAVRQGLLGSVGCDQYAVGRAAGKLLVQVLEGKQDVPVVRPDAQEIQVNCETAETLGFESLRSEYCASDQKRSFNESGK